MWSKESKWKSQKLFYPCKKDEKRRGVSIHLSAEILDRYVDKMRLQFKALQ